MKNRKIIVAIICLLAISLAIVLHFIDGGTITTGTWSKTPIDNLKEYSGSGITYQAIETVYFGENGKDGAVLFYLEQKTNSEESIFKIGFFKAKNKSKENVYTHYSSYAILKENLRENKMNINPFEDSVNFNCFFALTQMSNSDIFKQYPSLSNSQINTIKFNINSEEYSVKYILKFFNSQTEAESFKNTINS